MSEAFLHRSGLYSTVILLAWKLASSHAVEGDSGRAMLNSFSLELGMQVLPHLPGSPAEQEGRGLWLGHSNW